MPLHDWTRVDAGIFHDFHTVWIGHLRTSLNSGLLPPEFFALAEQVAGDIGPDVLTLREPDSDGSDFDSTDDESRGGLAVALAPPKVSHTAHSDEEIYTGKQRQLTIRHASGHRIVAFVEIVSPGNKSSHHAFANLVNKSLAALRRGIHLLLIDPQPPSPRDPQGLHSALWTKLTGKGYHPPPGKDRTLAAYVAGLGNTAYVEPIAIGQTLPEMPLFLSKDRYINVPLEATYQAAYEGVPRLYRKILDG